MTDRFKFTVDRGTWLHAGICNGGTWSFLLDARGRKCCMGFLAEQCGYPLRVGVRVLSRLDDFEKLPAALRPRCKGWDNALADEVYELNDNLVNNAEREAKLTALLVSAGIDVEFTGEYPK